MIRYQGIPVSFVVGKCKFGTCRVIVKIKLILGASILLLSGQVNGADMPSKDWVWNIDDEEVFYAATLNSKEHGFGQYCDLNSEECYYLMATKVTCDNELPALLNSDKGALNVTLVCGDLIEGENILYIKPFDDIDLLVRQGNYFRIAIPMENNQFKVIRFSLIGSTYAIDLMRAAAEKRIDILKKVTSSQDEQYL